MVLTYVCFALFISHTVILMLFLTYMFIHVEMSKIINVTNFVSSGLAVCWSKSLQLDYIRILSTF